MRALVLSGGGSKGAFQAGVIRALFEADSRSWYQAYCGVSVGAINSLFLSQCSSDADYGEIDYMTRKLVEMWQRTEDKDVKKNWLLGWLAGFWKTGLYNTEPLEKLIKRYTNYNLVATSGNELRIGAVNLNTGKYEVFDQYYKHLVKATMASAAFPMMFPAVKMRGGLYVDGGVRNVTPLKSAIDIPGVTEVDVVLTFNPKDGHKPSKDPKNVVEVAGKTINSMMNEILLNDLKVAKLYNDLAGTEGYEDKRKIKIRIFYPTRSLNVAGLDSLKFDPEKTKHMLDVGYDSARELLKTS